MTLPDFIEPRYAIYLMVVIGTLVLVEGLRQAFFEDDADARTKLTRMRALSGSDNVEKALGKLRREVVRSHWSFVHFFGNLSTRMTQAGMTMKPKVLMVSVVVATALGIVSLTPFTGVLIALAASIGVATFAPMIVINALRKRRIAKFSLQLPDALDLMKRGLSVGHPVNTTIRNIANTMDDPVATEFRRVADQVAYGDTLSDAMTDMAKRIDQEDVYYLAASIQIQHGTGGNLGAMLGTLSEVIRKRFAMRRRIQAVSSEGRISALILSSLPFIMYGGTLLTAPDYFSSVSDDPLFWPMCALIAFFVVGNGLVLRKLVNFRY